jgi:hypothetical protein
MLFRWRRSPPLICCPLLVPPTGARGRGGGDRSAPSCSRSEPPPPERKGVSSSLAPPADPAHLLAVRPRQHCHHLHLCLRLLGLSRLGGNTTTMPGLRACTACRLGASPGRHIRRAQILREEIFASTTRAAGVVARSRGCRRGRERRRLGKTSELRRRTRSSRDPALPLPWTRRRQICFPPALPPRRATLPRPLRAPQERQGRRASPPSRSPTATREAGTPILSVVPLRDKEATGVGEEKLPLLHRWRTKQSSSAPAPPSSPLPSAPVGELARHVPAGELAALLLSSLVPSLSSVVLAPFSYL